MSIKDRGFGSASKKRRSELSAKGGKKAHQLGKAHQWTSDEAKAAVAKATDARRLRSANLAALWLMKKGFSVAELNPLQLTLDEFIYYGGSQSTAERILELKNRICASKPECIC